MRRENNTLDMWNNHDLRDKYRIYVLQKTVSFFDHHFGKRLDLQDQIEFIDFWYVLIIINDTLTICGSIVKIEIENKVSNWQLLVGYFASTVTYFT